MQSGTWFNASVIDWLLRCRCGQSLQGWSLWVHLRDNDCSKNQSFSFAFLRRFAYRQQLCQNDPHSHGSLQIETNMLDMSPLSQIKFFAVYTETITVSFSKTCTLFETGFRKSVFPGPQNAVDM